MSPEVELDLMGQGLEMTRFEDYCDSSKDLNRSCMQLLHHSQWIPWRQIQCGSYAEIPLYGPLAKYFNIDINNLDADKMSYCTDRNAVHRSVSLPETYTGEIIRIYTDDVHAGYARLIREKDSKEVLLSDLYTLAHGEIIHGPAYFSDLKSYIVNILNRAAEDTGKLSNYVWNRDHVHAIHSPYWPVEATEWITRKRCHGFPLNSVIKQVIRYGCDFVQVSYNRLSNNGEWRFSFSKAELLIAKSWTISQRIVYTSLWVLNKKVENSRLCTYYLKTLMFWACEEKPTQFWRDEWLVHTVYELLIEMMNWLKLKFCANYFLPGNNMMDHLINTDLSNEIEAVYKITQSLQYMAEVIDVCRQRELLISVNTMRHIESPAWIKRACVLYQRIHNDYDNYTDLFCTDFTSDLQKALYVELSDSYRGLYFQQKFASCVNVSEKSINFLKAESHLLLATNLCESQKKDVINNCSLEFAKSMFSHFVSCNVDALQREGNNNIQLRIINDDGRESKPKTVIFDCSDKAVKSITIYAVVASDGVISSGASDDYVDLNITDNSTADGHMSSMNHKEHKYLLFSRFMNKSENYLVNNYWSERINKSRRVNITEYAIRLMTKSTEMLFLKEWPGRSPTVNISWFIAKAYLANLYYTTQSDVSLTIKTCDDIIHVYGHSHMNFEYAEKTFAVVLSTQWTSIYDKEIQELLGFYSLSSYVLNQNSRLVYLGVCPIQFAYYLKERTAVDHSTRDWKDKFNEYKEHLPKCGSMMKIGNGIRILHTSFLNLSITRGLPVVLLKPDGKNLRLFKCDGCYLCK